MSKAKVAIGVAMAVWSALMVAVGKVWGNAEGEKDLQKMNAENEELRRKLCSLLETIKVEFAAKNQNIAGLDAVIKKLIKRTPINQSELAVILYEMNLTDGQFEAIMAHAAPFYQKAA